MTTTDALRPITSAANRKTMGLSATAAFATKQDCVASAGTLCIARSPSAPGDRIFGRGQRAVPNADASLVSKDAKDRGYDQLGTMGSGNHFVEVDVVERVPLHSMGRGEE